MGWWPVSSRSMIERRRCPNPTCHPESEVILSPVRLKNSKPDPSGPRCATQSFIFFRIALSTSPDLLTNAVMPHILIHAIFFYPTSAGLLPQQKLLHSLQ